MDSTPTDPLGSRHPLGLTALTLLPPAAKERTRLVARPLKTAIEAWDWKVKVVCDLIDRKRFETMFGPAGETVIRPHLIKRQAWESDLSQIEATTRRLREAEVAAGLPAGRMILASGHSIGRAYNIPVRYSRSYALVRLILKDNGAPYQIARRLFRFADDTLETHSVDLLYAFEYATPLNIAFWFAAQRRGIPCVAMRYSKIVPDHAFFTTDPKMFNAPSLALAESRGGTDTPVSEDARHHVEAFRNQPKVINYIAAKWHARMRRGFVRWHILNGRTIAREFINGFRGQDTALRERPFGRLSRYYHSMYLTYRSQRYYNSLDEAELEGCKYVYFPLHKEAEIAQTFQATLWHDQRNTIRVLASLLPFGYRLLAREHRMNTGFRPLNSYRELSEIPNVTLIDPFDSQYKYIRHADLVVTENGSSGWEGLLMGRRVLLLSKTFYDGEDRGVTVKDPTRLNAAILEMLAQPITDETLERTTALARMIDAERETVFPITDDVDDRASDRLSAVLAAHTEAQSAPVRPAHGAP